MDKQYQPDSSSSKVRHESSSNEEYIIEGLKHGIRRTKEFEVGHDIRVAEDATLRMDEPLKSVKAAPGAKGERAPRDGRLTPPSLASLCPAPL